MEQPRLEGVSPRLIEAFAIDADERYGRPIEAYALEFCRDIGELNSAPAWEAGEHFGSDRVRDNAQC